MNYLRKEDLKKDIQIERKCESIKEEIKQKI